MDRLSSCYFCGAALDATLEEHPVVPSALHPGTDAQKTVVLCRTCQRKLDAVLDTVVDAVEANAGDVAAGTEPDESPGSGDSAAAGDTSQGDIESTLGDDEEILTPLGDEESTADEAAEASDMEFGDDRAADDESDSEGESNDGDGPSKARKYTRSRGAGFRKEDDGPSETGSLTGGAFEGDDEDDSDSGSLTGDAFEDDDAGNASTGGSASDGDESSDPLADDSARSGSGESGSGSGSGGQSSGSPSDGGSDEGSGAGSDDDGASGSDDDGEHRVSMSRLENTKVMRLLENREFPVDKAEFVTVAANAYQVSQSDCEKVIDLAVEHDLLREENGQLYGGDA
ncbi:hypothetical protein [Halosimplex pelagicum]|uniref:Uncharacterized protein n=1 Tax=Halosimplex pelagicum TaxID=869886 RepID=A0A7D5T7F5_9EURY|nr:hypothetical protein [Halosimplex pelagicum]QLH84108.1 hypothetical protein HZS54_21795 [Halosimplex pelagicum]